MYSVLNAYCFKGTRQHRSKDCHCKDTIKTALDNLVARLMAAAAYARSLGLRNGHKTHIQYSSQAICNGETDPTTNQIEHEHCTISSHILLVLYSIHLWARAKCFPHILTYIVSYISYST